MFIIVIIALFILTNLGFSLLKSSFRFSLREANFDKNILLCASVALFLEDFYSILTNIGIICLQNANLCDRQSLLVASISLHGQDHS